MDEIAPPIAHNQTPAFQAAVNAQKLRPNTTAPSPHSWKNTAPLKTHEHLFNEDRPSASRSHAFLDEFRIACQNPAVRVVTFDCFDTILWRPFRTAADLFWILGRNLAHIGLLPPDFSPAAFAEARRAAERTARHRKARAGLYPEISLLEIYSEFTFLTSHERQNACTVEVETEAAHTYLDPSIAAAIALAAEVNKDIHIISNTYFSRHELAKLLSNKMPISLPQTCIHVSSEYGIGKEAGLLTVVLSKLGWSPAEALHVGDNQWDDYQIARRSGIQVVYYPKFADVYPGIEQREARMRSFVGDGLEPKLDILPQVRRLILNALGRERKLLEAEKIGAFILGPALVAFALWVIRKVHGYGPAPVLCLTREGLFLSEAFRSVATLVGAGEFVSLPFLSSRSIIFSASFFEFSLDELETFLLFRRTPFTLGTFCQLVGRTFGSEDFGLEPHQMDIPLLNDMPMTYTIMAAMAQHSELRAATLDFSARWRECFKTYVNDVFGRWGVTLGPGGLLYVADVGWSGKSQRLLEKVMHAIGYDVRLCGLYMATDVSACGEQMRGLRAEGWLYDSGEPRRTSAIGLHCKEIIEQIFSSHLGAVKSYQADGTPVFSEPTKSLTQRNDLRRLRNAARAALSEYNDIFNLIEPEELDEAFRLPDSYRMSYLGLVALPTPEEYALFSEWTHEENNLSDNMESLSSEYWSTFAAYATVQQYINAPSYWKLPTFSRARPILADSMLLRLTAIPTSFREESRPFTVTIETDDGRSETEQLTAYFSVDGRGILSTARICPAKTTFSFSIQGSSSLAVDAVLLCVYDPADRTRQEQILRPDFNCFPETKGNSDTLYSDRAFRVTLIKPARLMFPVSVVICVRSA